MFIELLLLLVIVLAYAIRTEAFQTYLAQRAADYLSDELETTVSINQVYVHFFDGLEFRQLYIEDQHGDTLIYANTFTGTVDFIDAEHNYLQFGNVWLQDARVKLQKYAGDSTLNLNFFTDYFKSEDTTSTKWIIEMDDIRLGETHFSYKDHNNTDTVTGMNFTDIDASHLTLAIRDFDMLHDTIFANITQLQMQEQSGFQLDSMSARLRFSPNGFSLDKLQLNTPGSKLYTNLSFEYDSLSAFSDFVHSVAFRNEADSIDLNLSDLGYFVPALYGIDKIIHLEGTVRGTVDRLKGRNLYLKVADSTYFDGRFDLTGLPEIMETSITVTVNELTTNGDELISFLVPMVDSTVFKGAEPYLNRVGQISFDGSFMGFVNDFVAYGTLRSDMGRLDTDMSFHSDTTGEFYANGNLSTRDFNVGSLVGTNELGRITSNFELSAHGQDFNHAEARIDGGITSLVMHGYEYRNWIVLGDVTKDLFLGTVYLRDDNIDMNFDGVVDFSGAIPKMDFKGDIHNANLERLNLITGSHPSSSLCLEYVADFEGNSIDNIIGNINLYGVDYYEKDHEYDLGDVSVSSEYYGDIKSLYIETKMFDASITGDFKIDELPNNMKSLIAEILPSFDRDFYPERTYSQLFDFEIITEDVTMLSDLFMPSLHVSPFSYIYGNFNSTRMEFGISGIMNDFRLNQYDMQGFSFNVEKNSDVVTATIEANELFVADSISFQKFLFGAKARQDGVETWLEWNNEDSDSWGDIEGYANVISPTEIEFDLWKSEVRLLQKDWILDESAYIRYDSSGINIHGFEACNGQQSVLVNGLISENPDDQLVVYLDHFHLSNINPLVSSSNMQFGGVITGGGYVSNLLNNIYFETDIEVSDFLLNNHYVGNIEMKNAWDNTEKRMSFDGGLREYFTRTIRFGGDFYPQKKDDNVKLTLRLDEANLDWLGGILPPEVSNFQGYATGNLELTGTFEKPNIDGIVKLYDAGVNVNMLNTFYQFSGDISMDSQYGMIALDYVPIIDENGQRSFANGTFLHNYFTDFNFDIFLSMDSMLCLNTTKKMNSLYYGKALASGSVNIYTGYMGDIVIDVQAESKKGTLVNLPLDGAQDVVLQDFVNFIDHDTMHVKEVVDLTGVTMNFELDVTPDAKMRIIFDEAIGDVVEGRGKGHISMMITTGGQFEMYGQYEITEGSYMFTYQNTFAKRFVVEPGGTVSWFGDPYGADLNLVAVYPLKATVADLVPSLAGRYRKPVPVEVQMHMTHSLFNPDIDFDIDLPTIDEGAMSQVQTAISTSQEMNRQVFALIVLNQFILPDNGIQDASSSTSFGSSGFAVINNQVNDMLSDISNNFDIGVNYTPGDELSSEEMALALGTQLLDGKIEINGNFGVSNAPTGVEADDPSSIIGDVDIEYHVNEDETFNIHAFNESVEFDPTNNQATKYTQGVGVYYEEEFDDLGELEILQRFLNIFRKCENKKFHPKPCNQAKRGKKPDVTEE